MGQNLSYITLESIVLDYLMETEQSNSKYYKVWHLAFRGMDNMGLDFFYSIQSVKLPVNANLTVDIPADYLNWTKVGVLNNKGEIIPLYHNPKLTTYADLSPDRLEKTQDDSSIIYQDWGLNTWANYWNGAAYTNIYGVPSGAPFVGDFKVDLDNGVILLNERFRYDYVMLEYMARPVQGKEYYVPTQFREALIAWIAWKDSNAKTINSHMSLGDKRDKKHNFYNERRNAIAQWKPIRIAEKYQASQEMSRLAIKT